MHLRSLLPHPQRPTPQRGYPHVVPQGELLTFDGGRNEELSLILLAVSIVAVAATAAAVDVAAASDGAIALARAMPPLATIAPMLPATCGCACVFLKRGRLAPQQTTRIDLGALCSTYGGENVNRTRANIQASRLMAALREAHSASESGSLHPDALGCKYGGGSVSDSRPMVGNNVAIKSPTSKLISIIILKHWHRSSHRCCQHGRQQRRLSDQAANGNRQRTLSMEARAARQGKPHKDIDSGGRQRRRSEKERRKHEEKRRIGAPRYP